jgi:hypothetical protein
MSERFRSGQSKRINTVLQIVGEVACERIAEGFGIGHVSEY